MKCGVGGSRGRETWWAEYGYLSICVDCDGSGVFGSVVVVDQLLGEGRVLWRERRRRALRKLVQVVRHATFKLG